MARKIRRQQQISKIPRKKGRYASQDQVTIVDEIIEERSEDEVVEKFAENEIIENVISDNEIEDETVEDWLKEDLEAFKEIGKRFINETLHWHEDASSNIRAIYTGDSRTTLWRKEKKKTELEKHAKEIRKIDTFFKPASEDIGSSKQMPIDTKLDLHTCLEKLNQLCSIGKSKKENYNIFTYDYVRLLSVRQFIQKLLNGEGKIAASNQISQDMWNKGNYMARCIRK